MIRRGLPISKFYIPALSVFSASRTAVVDAHGDDASIPRWVGHCALLTDQGAVGSLRPYFSELISAPGLIWRGDAESIVRDSKRVDCPADIEARALPLFDLLAENGGSYEG